jgi:hypothetical protein
MLIHDHFQNFKVYQIPKAQLIIADVPYNLGNNAYASNPAWYKDGDNSNGESELAFMCPGCKPIIFNRIILFFSNLKTMFVN